MLFLEYIIFGKYNRNLYFAQRFKTQVQARTKYKKKKKITISKNLTLNSSSRITVDLDPQQINILIMNNLSKMTLFIYFVCKQLRFRKRLPKEDYVVCFVLQLSSEYVISISFLFFSNYSPITAADHRQSQQTTECNDTS